MTIFHFLKHRLILKTNTLIMMGIILVYGISYFIYGETVPGFGWDGVVYKSITQNFYEKVFVTGLDQYYIQRIFVPAFLNLIFYLIRVPLIDVNILWGFKIFNLVCLIIGIYFYSLIAEELRFKNKVMWLGFAALFMNFAVLKHNFYYPVLLDTTIFALSIIQFYSYLKNNLIALIITTIVGAFTWPSFLYPSILLILFPIHNEVVKYDKNKIKLLIILLIMTFFSLCLCILYPKYAFIVTGQGENPINSSFIVVSIISLLAYIYLALNPLLKDNRLFKVKSYFKEIRLKTIIIAAIIFCSVIILVSLQHPNKSVNIKSFVGTSLLISISQPLIFLLSHIIYFGPVMLLTIYYWKSISSSIHSYGLGIALFVLFYILIGINSESRRIINAVPVFIILTMIVINRFDIKSIHVVLFFIISLIFSKFWFIFNIPVFSHGLNGGYQKFPDQKYFMNLGPWMSNEMYLLQGSIVYLRGSDILYSEEIL